MEAFQIKSSSQQLMAKARELTGITDIIDSSIEEALERMLQSLNDEAQLSQQGVIAMEQRLLRLLSNRLRMQRDYRAHPEIDDQKILPPLIISGAGRTGSTKLHKMLAASGDFLYLPFWQSHNFVSFGGDRKEDPTARIKDADDYIHWFDTQAPGAKLSHPYGTYEPEEENLIHEHAICSPYIQAMAFVPSYLQWWASQDFRPQMEFLKQALKYVQWQFYDGDSRPWILKCPLYPGHEPVLAEVFQGARFVATHRDPGAVISSAASLFASYHRAYSDARRDQMLGPMYLGFMSMLYENYLTVRDSNPDLPLLDVGYAELTQNAAMTIEKVYAHLQMPLSGQARQLMQNWERENSQHKLGAHKHALDTYSLTDEMIQKRCARYIERFGRCF